MLLLEGLPIIIKDVKVHQLHSWQISIAQAEEIQRKLASQVSQKSEITNLRFIAGVDISAPDSKGIARAAAVILNYPKLEVIEVKIAEDKLGFPYIPGLLSFRESPLVLAACQKLSTSPDLLLVDGQGIAHPRRFGLASHLGLLLDMPTIGCAKSRLCGKHEPLATEASACSELIDNDEVIGVVLRTKAKANPVYISIGHKIDLPTAIHWVTECRRGYRLPEPSRLAHLAAGGKPIAAHYNYQQKLFS
jgi:deoxyribonuclease V